jgi:hypothetical protein
MATIITRAGKAFPLTHNEVDANFTNLNTDKLEISSVNRGGNTVIGTEAFASHLSGSGNVAAGYRALYSSTTAVNNSALGYNALYSNTTGGSNTASGVNTLYSNTTGGSNTASGVDALYYNTTGGSNTAAGVSALQSNTTGLSNTAAGTGTLFSNTTGGSNAAAGSNALFSNTTGESNAVVGAAALYYNTTGRSNTALGVNCLFNCTTGSGNIGLGGQNSGGGYAPVFNVTTENNRVVMGSTAVTNAYIQVAWTVVSDARDKTNFAPVPHGLAFVNALKPTAYQFKESRASTETNGPLRYGFLAQDILGLEGPGSVIIDAEDPEKLRYNGESLVPVLVNAIQELTAMVTALQAELAA